MPLMMTSLTGATFWEKLISLSSSGSEYKLLKMFEFIKAVSNTEFEMINAVDQDKCLILIGAMFQEKLVSHSRAVNEADSCLLMRRAGSKDVVRVYQS